MSRLDDLNFANPTATLTSTTATKPPPSTPNRILLLPLYYVPIKQGYATLAENKDEAGRIE